jgi:hypothetical protein
LTSELLSGALCARSASGFPPGALQLLGQFAIEIFAACFLLLHFLAAPYSE